MDWFPELNCSLVINIGLWLVLILITIFGGLFLYKIPKSYQVRDTFMDEYDDTSDLGPK